jgi:ABC-2 type transport system permease protein
MTLTLIRKLLRDVRLPLLLVCALVLLFQLLWARITHRVVGEIAPYFAYLTGGPEGIKDFLSIIFAGPGKIIQTVIGGESIQLDRTMDMLSIGYVHPLMQFIFCIWAVGRASGAIAGEIDRATMELILSQPLPRSRLVLAHLLVDLITIPLICLSLWGGNWLGYWLLGPVEIKEPPPEVQHMAALSPLNRLGGPKEPPRPDPARLQIDPMAFGPALPAVAALIFAVAGCTMALSARGRFRWRVLGTAVFVFLIMFLLNLIGQMWEEGFGWARPFTVFYYYQPQQIILDHSWGVALHLWPGSEGVVRVPGPAVLLTIGVCGYALALAIFTRRDLPAPL